MFVMISAFIASMVLLHCNDSSFKFDRWHSFSLYSKGTIKHVLNTFVSLSNIPKSTFFIDILVIRMSAFSSIYWNKMALFFFFCSKHHKSISFRKSWPCFIAIFQFHVGCILCIAVQREACVYSGTRGRLTASQPRKTPLMFTSRTIMSMSLENRNRK